ncbi:MAG TPA: HAD-IIIC family phosphatase [Verrucomicrobiae bacterium]|nr:HAD-IIIC family phosphatase [Verrucomicrobiae bacterium]
MAAANRFQSLLLRPCQLLVGFIQLFFLPMLAALSLAAACAQVTRPVPPWLWIALAPLLYFLWLLIFLLLAVLETTLIAPLFKRPERYHQKKDGWLNFQFTVTWILYNRAFVLYSLPFLRYLLPLPGLNWLILRACAPHASIGRDAWIAGTVWDPEITTIGHNAILGTGSQIVAHSLVRTVDGFFLYQSAPIVLGPNCVIGGDARVALGARIGEGAIIEPHGNVQPFTIVPAGEIWGGNPAVFRARRELPGGTPVAPVAAPLKDEAAICQVIATALKLPFKEISRETSAANCLAWDSLGKMAIAAALHDRFRVNLPPEKVFTLDSVAHVVAAIAPATKNEMAAAGEFQLPADPELLPLLEPAEVLAVLSQKTLEATAANGRQKIPVIIAATFVAQPLAPALELYARAFGLEAEAVFYDFNQVPQALLSPASPLRKNQAGLNVVLVRPEDLPGENQGERQAVAAQWLAAIKEFATTSGCTLLVADLPPAISPDRPELSAEFPSLQIWWRQQLEMIAGVKILGFAEIIAELGAAGARDTQMERAASTPFSAATYQRLGVSLARTVRATRLPPKKVLALDCDNTLWGGVIGEDGLDGLRLDASTGRSFRVLQSKILALNERGVLLVLVSKNMEADVWNVIDNHPDMLPRRKDFAAARINWQPKSENLRALAAELNLGLDAFVLLDDSPAEQLEVTANCPAVTVVPLPSEPDRYAEMLSRLWLFDGAGETGEDRLRNAFTQQELTRRELQQSSGTLAAYLASLELRATIRRSTEADLVRVAQMLQKTNQFNLSLKRRTLPEIRALLPEHEIWILMARDRFGDYGLVGVCITRPEGDALLLDSLLMSCRALGRGLEESFLHVMARQAQAAGATFVRGQFVPGARNEPMKQFLEKSAFVRAGHDLFELHVANAPSAPVHIVLEA